MYKKIIFSVIIFLCLFTCEAKGDTLLQPNRVKNLWYSWAQDQGSNTDIFCNQWNGTKWSDPIQITNTPNNEFTPAVALDKNNNPWIVWTGWDGTSTSIFCKYFDGQKWSDIKQVDDVDIYSDTMPAITIDENNTSWITWAGSDGKDDDIYVSSWDGIRWKTPVMINSDNFTPDIMPVISTDNNNNVIVAWCGFDIDRYKIFFSKKTKNLWPQQQIVTNDMERFSVNLPNMLKTKDKEIELLWLEKNIYYKSLWNGSTWSDPEQTEFLLPTDFFNTISFGPAYASWTKDKINQSLKIIPPRSKNKPTVHSNLIVTKAKKHSWINDIFISTAYAEVETNKYIAFGDSVTEGVGASNRSTTAYPPKLERKLTLDIAPSIVVNEGLGGENTAGGIARINDVLAANNAEYILILEGINDMTAQWAFETTAFNLGVMIDRAREFGTTPFLSKLPPRTDNVGFRVPYVNAHLEILAEEKQVTLVDQYSEMNQDADRYLIIDHKHPNDAGYELMATIWFDAINALINPPSDDDGGGCGVVPPIYRKGSGNGLGNNIFPLLIFTTIIILVRRKFAA